MSITLIIIVAELIVVLLGVIGFLFFLRWKQKKAQAVEFEGLLDSFSNKEAERTIQLTQLLKGSYGVESEEAKESAGYMLEAEKQFLQQFLKQQLEQTTVTGFYSDLCELLDQYLYFIPVTTSENADLDTADVGQDAIPKEVDEELLEQLASQDDDSEKQSAQNESENEVENTQVSSESEDIEPDWGEAFAESGDEMDEDVKAGFEEESEVVISDNDETSKDEPSEPQPEVDVVDEEPDWGEAFSESGDTVDEATQAGFEAESKKE